MKAIILAAGIGNRLGDISGGRPKCLLEFNHQDLLTRHVRTLEQTRVSELLVVTGYRNEEIDSVLSGLTPSLEIRTVYNSDFKRWRQS